MAESVDALVSNTNDSNVVPVRPRLWVHSQDFSIFFREVFLFSRVFVEKKQARCFYTAGLLLFMHIASGVAKQSLVTIHLSTVSATTR